MQCLVMGAGGFIGHNLVKRLKGDGHFVVGVDLKLPEFEMTEADHFYKVDLREPAAVKLVLDHYYDEIYQLAADMGGAGYIFTGAHDADVMHNSATINLNVLDRCRKNKFQGKIFYSSSACIYPAHNQENQDDPKTEEGSVYPANPDSEYGWEKLFSERLYAAYRRNYGLDTKVARFHNIFGPFGTYKGGREKAPAALCRKVAEAEDGASIEVWGDGKQTRSFLYIEECLDGVLKFIRQDKFHGPVNIGSSEMVSINKLAEMIIWLSGKKLTLEHVAGPLGVRGRTSHNNLITEMLGWQPSQPLGYGLEKTYAWIENQIKHQTRYEELEKAHG